MSQLWGRNPVNMTPFKQKQLPKPSFLEKLFGNYRKELVEVQLNNLLAEKGIDEISKKDVQEIFSTNKQHLSSYYQLKIAELYKIYFSFCVKDLKLSTLDVDRLKKFQEVFSIDDNQAKETHNQITAIKYREQVERILSDGLISEEDNKYLEKLKSDLQLDESEAQSILDQGRISYVQGLSSEILSADVYTPEKEKQFYLACKNLNVSLKLEDNALSELSRNKVIWEIRHGNIPEVDVPIKIQKSEKCYFKAYCEWQEERKVTKRYNYGGPTARIKLAKGIYYRAGSLAIRPTSEDVLMTIDAGDIYLTNKRFIFVGKKGGKTIPLGRILNFKPYSNGVEIFKDAGKNPFLAFRDDNYVFSLILARLIEEY